MLNIGVYSIRNIVSNKRYIGSSKNITNRWRVHKSRLRLNKHHSLHLQNSYNLDSDNFIFEIIELTTLDQLEIREQYWVDFYCTYNKQFGYNAVRTVSSINPERMRERWAKPGAKEAQSILMKNICSDPQHRQKLSIGHKKHFEDPNNRRQKLLTSPHRKRVLYIETNEIFESIAEASRKLGISVVKIRDSFTGKRRSNCNMSFKLVINEQK